MKKFSFSNKEIDAAKVSDNEWLRFVRTKEAEIALEIANRRFGFALELGAGNGGQSEILSTACDKLICTDVDPDSHKWMSGSSFLDRQKHNVEYRVVDAQDLSEFDDGTFDLIFSSNMLEHVPDVMTCLAECRRVLKKDGVMLHSMPGRAWKVFHHLLMFVRLFPRVWRLPRIHGVSKSHFRELYEFGPNVWADKFSAADLYVEDIIGMPFYVGHGNRFVPLTKLGNKLGLSATFLFVVKGSSK